MVLKIFELINNRLKVPDRDSIDLNLLNWFNVDTPYSLKWWYWDALKIVTYHGDVMEQVQPTWVQLNCNGSETPPASYLTCSIPSHSKGVLPLLHWHINDLISWCKGAPVSSGIIRYLYSLHDLEVFKHIQAVQAMLRGVMIWATRANSMLSICQLAGGMTCMTQARGSSKGPMFASKTTID